MFSHFMLLDDKTTGKTTKKQYWIPQWISLKAKLLLQNPTTVCIREILKAVSASDIRLVARWNCTVKDGNNGK